MIYSYARAKEIILRATYETLVFWSDFESFEAEAIHTRVKETFSAGFVRRVLSSLAEDELVRIEQYDENSARHYTITDKGIESAERLQGYQILINQPDIPDAYAPASDRIVSRSDNLPIVEEIESDLAALKAELATNNEIGSALGDDRELVEHQIEVAEQEIGREKFRIASLIGWLRPIIRFLSKRFAGSSVDEIVARIAQALEKLV